MPMATFFSEGITPTQTALFRRSAGIPFSGGVISSVTTCADFSNRSACRSSARPTRTLPHNTRESPIANPYRICETSAVNFGLRYLASLSLCLSTRTRRLDILPQFARPREETSTRYNDHGLLNSIDPDGNRQP